MIWGQYCLKRKHYVGALIDYFMADKVHKQDTYFPPSPPSVFYSDNGPDHPEGRVNVPGTGYEIQNDIPVQIKVTSSDEFEESCMNFTTWLDIHCRGGWSVIKISSDFSGEGGTWCVFQR